MSDVEMCPHCDRHDDPRRRPWAVQVAPADDAEKPLTLLVSRTDASHVAESDAAWLRDLIASYRSQSEHPEWDS